MGHCTRQAPGGTAVAAHTGAATARTSSPADYGTETGMPNVADPLRQKFVPSGCQ